MYSSRGGPHNEQPTRAGAVRVIGASEQGRPLLVWYIGDPAAAFRILVIAGQHGDEAYVRNAVGRWMTSLQGETVGPPTLLAIIQNANPDGSLKRTRSNACGIDLNRDHQRLESRETRALHALVRSWRPHLIVDAHNYPPRRKHLLAKHLILACDVFVDVATHPAVTERVGSETMGELLASLQADIRSDDVSCERYVLVRPSGRARHGTPDVVDARNALALRYGAFTVLLEGRTPTRADGEAGAERAVGVHQRALQRVLGWARRNATALTAIAEARPQAGESVAVGCRYRRAGEPLVLQCVDARDGTIKAVRFPKYTPHVAVTEAVTLPAAYAVPLDRTRAIEILGRQAYEFRPGDASTARRVERYVVGSAKPSRRKNRTARRIALDVRVEERTLDGYVLFPTDQVGGRSLAVLLEPRSKYGLHRYDDLGLAMRPGFDYPILRVHG